MDRRLAGVFAEPDPTAGLRNANLLAKELELAYPDAAGSLREGLEEMFTVARLGASPTLRRSLTTTNAIWVAHLHRPHHDGAREELA